MSSQFLVQGPHISSQKSCGRIPSTLKAHLPLQSFGHNRPNMIDVKDSRGKPLIARPDSFKEVLALASQVLEIGLKSSHRSGHNLPVMHCKVKPPPGGSLPMPVVAHATARPAKRPRACERHATGAQWLINQVIVLVVEGVQRYRFCSPAHLASCNLNCLSLWGARPWASYATALCTDLLHRRALIGRLASLSLSILLKRFLPF